MKSITKFGLMLALTAGSVAVGSFSSAVWAEGPTTASSLPSGESIVEKFITATGGRDAYTKFENRVSTGTYEVPAQGMKANLTLIQKRPAIGVLELDIPGMGKFAQGSDGETVWANDPMQGVRILEGNERDMLMRQFRFDGDLDWKKYYKQAETTGEEEVDGKPAYVVKLTSTTEGADPTINYYDKETGLLLQSKMSMDTQMGKMDVVSKVNEYKDFDGVKIPAVSTQQVAGTEIKVTVVSVEHNKTIEPEKLAIPPEVLKLKEKTGK